MSDLDLAGKHAVVTGGTRGIGRATVLGLARRRASVTVVYRTEGEAVESLRSELARIDATCRFVKADVADEREVGALGSALRLAASKVDVLVNNAGVVSHRTLEEMELAEWQRVVHTNLTGMFLVTKEIVATMSAGAAIVNVTSAVAMRGMVARSHYTASKAGIIGFTRSLAKELGPRQIRANAIAPGIVATDQAAGLSEERLARYRAMPALGRVACAEEIADVVLFLASPLSRFVTGQTLVVDGGI